MKNDLLLQLDKLNYPVLLLNEENEFIWGNSKFKTLHKSAFKKNILVDQSVLFSVVSIINEVEYEVEYIHNKHYFSIIESHLELDNKNYKFLTFFDISKRHKLTKKISEKQHMFEVLSEYLPEGIVLYNEKIIYTNPAFEKLTGYSGRELKNINFVELFLPQTRNELQELMTEMSLKKRKKSKLYADIRRKKGDILHIEIKTQALIIDNEINFLSIMTNITKKLKEEQKLKELAYIDTLTGIYNRRKFDELLKMEYNRAKRYKSNLSALFFDIDFFKKVNDNYGHDIGDDVLKTVSDLVAKHIRETDLFARWGGEEFIILLPETTINDALIMAENIRIGVETNVFSKVGKITVSIGVTKLKDKEYMETFIKRLDNALYKAKNAGRNQVIKL